MTGISAIVVTRHPSARVVELLGSVRSAVDELIVAVDDRAGDQGLGALEPHADSVATFQFDHSIERQWEWIAALATGEWLLWLDDDELPSPALVSSIPRLVEATDVTHYHLRRTWIWPDAGRGLAEPPWAPDFSPRLYRTDPALVWYPGLLHVPVKHVGPHRFVDEPLYHVDLVHNSEERRRAKAARYELLRPGLRVAGRAQNEAVYLPEDRALPPATVAIPREDRAVIERFLACSVERIDNAPPSRLVRRGSAEAISSVYRGATGSVRDSCMIQVVGSTEPTFAGVERSYEIRVENRGSDWLPAAGFQIADVYISYRWRAPDGSVVLDGGLRTPLPVSVPPGGSELLVIDVVPPDAPGRYTLGIDLVREHVHWFGCERRVDVAVRGLARVGVLGDPGDLSIAVDIARVLTAELPEVEFRLLTRDPGSTRAETGYEAELDPTSELLSSGRLSLLRAAVRPGKRSRPARSYEPVDVVVVAGASRLTGVGGRREALVLAACIRELARDHVPVAIVAAPVASPSDPVSRLAVKALAVVDRVVAPGSDAQLVSAIRELIARARPDERGTGLL